MLSTAKKLSSSKATKVIQSGNASTVDFPEFRGSRWDDVALIPQGAIGDFDREIRQAIGHRSLAALASVAPTDQRGVSALKGKT